MKNGILPTIPKKNGENLPTKKGFDIFDEQNNPRNVYFWIATKQMQTWALKQEKLFSHQLPGLIFDLDFSLVDSNLSQ